MHDWLSTMTGNRLRECREDMGLERWQMSRALDMDEDRLARMEDGVAPIPKDVAGRVLVVAAGLAEMS